MQFIQYNDDDDGTKSDPQQSSGGPKWSTPNYQYPVLLYCSDTGRRGKGIGRGRRRERRLTRGVRKGREEEVSPNNKKGRGVDRYPPVSRPLLPNMALESGAKQSKAKRA